MSLNLAEYVEESEEGEEGVTRRYLLQDSKINSTVRIGINMRQVDGEKSFVAPVLKTAAVFGGIAGIMAGEREGEESVGRMSPYYIHSHFRSQIPIWLLVMEIG